VTYFLIFNQSFFIAKLQESLPGWPQQLQVWCNWNWPVQNN